MKIIHLGKLIVDGCPDGTVNARLEHTLFDPEGQVFADYDDLSLAVAVATLEHIKQILILQHSPESQPCPAQNAQ